MGSRAQPSGISLTESDAALVKGMLARGDRQHDIAAYFGVNGGRIAEIAVGKTFPDVRAAKPHNLPEPGPYLSARATTDLLHELSAAQKALKAAEDLVRSVQQS
jgi:hypothetical protein